MDFLEECALKSAFQHPSCWRMLANFGGAALFRTGAAKIAALMMFAGVDHRSMAEVYKTNRTESESALLWIVDETPIEADLAETYCRALVKARPKESLSVLFGWARESVDGNGSLARIYKEIRALFASLGFGGGA